MTTIEQQDPFAANANVKRAIMATVDRMRAERACEAAGEELNGRVQLELMARAALAGDEVLAYEVGVTTAVQGGAVEAARA